MTERRSDYAPVIIGSLLPQLIHGKEAFADHDATKAWTDGGQANAVVAPQIDDTGRRDRAWSQLNAALDQIKSSATVLVAPQGTAVGVETVQAYGAEQVKEAMLNYAEHGQFGLSTLPDGRLGVAFTMSNAEADLIPLASLDDIFVKAAKSMLAAVGRDTERTAVIMALYNSMMTFNDNLQVLLLELQGSPKTERKPYADQSTRRATPRARRDGDVQ